MRCAGGACRHLGVEVQRVQDMEGGFLVGHGFTCVLHDTCQPASSTEPLPPPRWGAAKLLLLLVMTELVVVVVVVMLRAAAHPKTPSYPHYNWD